MSLPRRSAQFAARQRRLERLAASLPRPYRRADSVCASSMNSTMVRASFHLVDNAFSRFSNSPLHAGAACSMPRSEADELDVLQEIRHVALAFHVQPSTTAVLRRRDRRTQMGCSAPPAEDIDHLADFAICERRGTSILPARGLRQAGAGARRIAHRRGNDMERVQEYFEKGSGARPALPNWSSSTNPALEAVTIIRGLRTPREDLRLCPRRRGRGGGDAFCALFSGRQLPDKAVDVPIPPAPGEAQPHHAPGRHRG